MTIFGRGVERRVTMLRLKITITASNKELLCDGRIPFSAATKSGVRPFFI